MSVTPLVQQLTSALQKHPVFSILEGETLERLVQELELVSFVIGDTILTEGEPGDCAYLIYSGKVRVHKSGPGGKAITLATLSAGDLFGEHAILHDEARTASVRAAEDCVLFRIPRAAFASLLRDQPGLAQYLERLLRQRAVHRFLQLATVLGAVPARQVLALLDQLESCTFPSGQTVCREGEPGDRMYIIHAGEARVVQGGPGSETILTDLGPSDYFGERALILNEPRYASVVALTDLACFSLRRDHFERLLLSAPQLREQLTRRLEHYPLAEELARNSGAQQPVRKEADAPREPVWEKLETQQEPQRFAPPAHRRTWPGFCFRKQPFPFVPQREEADCGAASLAMITCYHNVPLSVERLRDLTHIGAEGASLLSLTQAADTLGFQWRAVSTDCEHLAGLTLPAIAHWKGYHYLVLYAQDGNQVILGDPARGLVTMSRQEFAAGWTGGLLLLTPTPDLLRHAPVRTGWQCFQPALAPFRNALPGVALLSALLAGLAGAIPLLTQLLVDRVLRGGEASWPLFSGLLLAGAGLSAAWRLRQRWLEHSCHGLGCHLTADWFDRLLKLPWRYCLSRPTGALLVRLESNRHVQHLLAQLTLTLLDLLLLFVGLGLLCSYHISLGLIMLAPLVLSAGWLFLVPVEEHAARYRRAHQEAAVRSAWVEAIQTIAALKGDNIETDVARRHRALLADPVLRDSARRLLPNLVLAGTVAASVFASVCTLGYGAHLVQQEQLSVGQLVALPVLVGLLAVSVVRLAGLWPAGEQFNRFLRDLAESEALLPEQGCEQPLLTLPRLRGFIRFEGVAFRHRPESRDVLAHIHLEVQPGQIVWVVGRTGAGKTTLAQLLQRLLLPTAGRISVDGFDLATVDLRSLRAQVSVVAEEPVLVQGTIRDNIALTESGATLERVIGAAKLASAHDFILRYPLAYDTTLGALGVQLSRGQRQSLCLARALFKEPRLLILDEATAALDAETERAVLKNLRWLGRDRTTLILTRRPLTVGPGDLVVMLEDGQIVEQGTPAELLQRNGLYAYLAAQQVLV